ncbi:hypothetical protein K3495_g10870 [Podosphaera aphanis]|nr:hypothetical protein K3495_g10870 [Podosphaera aphanis]
MAALIQGLFKGSESSSSSIPPSDPDFADFSGTSDPNLSPTSDQPTANLLSDSIISDPKSSTFTKWYNIHERYSPSDFKQEAVILSILLLIIFIHVLGTKSNRKKAKRLIAAYGQSLHREFKLLGFGDTPALDGEWQIESATSLLKEKSPSEFSTYATGRQNVAFLDFNISLLKRYSPLSLMAEAGMSLFFESITAPSEQVEAVIYPFDGREALLVPGQIPGANELRKDTKSTYDGFVWAVVNKDNIKQLRDDRYDISLTSTKDSNKLPNWATVMSESAEITEAILTPELIRNIEHCGELLNYLIITDQPVDQPAKIEETTPRKRLYLSLKIPSSGDYASTLPLFDFFLRLTDTLVQNAHFRPEVIRKVKSTRDEAIRKLQKMQEEEKAELRNLEREKAKKLKRDQELKALDSKAQKKYLEREKEKEIRRTQKKVTLKR